MECKFCGQKNLHLEETLDYGLDHHNFKLVKSKKLYVICHECFSIYRLDKNKLSFFDSDYTKLDRFPKKAGSENLINKKSINGKLPKLFSFRSIEIMNAIYEHKIMHNVTSVCEFGANNGELLSSLRLFYKIENSIGVEVDLFKDKNYGYKWFGNLNDAFSKNDIELLIASHSLLYTDYEELKEIISSKKSLRHIIIVSQDPIKRPASLFFDDSISNPSLYGKIKLIEKYGFKIIEASYLKNHPNETIVIGSRNNLNTKNKMPKINKRIFSVKEKKKYIWELYQSQANEIKNKDINTIFGTNIDSALLNHNCEGILYFSKDNAKAFEKFAGFEVIDINQIGENKVVIPKLLSNSKKIFERLKRKNINIYL